MSQIAASAFGGSSASGNLGADDTSMDANQVGSDTGGPGTSLLSGFGKGSAGLSALQGGATALSMLGTLGAANAKASSLRLQASQDMVNAQGATAAGYAQVSGMREQLTNLIGQRQAMAGAGGVDVGQGVAANTRQALSTASDTASNVALSAADIRNRSFQIGALNNQLAAKQAESGGILGALGQGLGLGLKFLMAG